MAEFSRRSSRTSARSKLVGQLLVENGDCTPEQINEALAHQEKQGGLLGSILQAMGVCSAEAISHALHAQVQITDVQCDDLVVPYELAQLISKEFCVREKLCPFEMLGNTICVVMGNPLNRKAIEDVESMTRCKVKAFKAVWPKISGLIERGYAESSSPAPQPAQQQVEDLSLELEGEPTHAQTAPPEIPLPGPGDDLVLEDDIIPASAPSEAPADAGILPQDTDVVPMPLESSVFTKPTINPKITGLESLDSGEAQLVDVSRRPTRKSGPTPTPKPARKPAKVNVDLETFDQSQPAETIDVQRTDSSDAMDEIPSGSLQQGAGMSPGEVLVALKVVPDSYFYQGPAPKNAPRSEELLDLIEVLPVAEVVAENIGDYERQQAGEPGSTETVVAHKSGRFASRVEYQRAPGTPMAAVRLGEGEYQKSILTWTEDPGGEWEWTVASPGPIAVDAFEE